MSDLLIPKWFAMAGTSASLWLMLFGYIDNDPVQVARMWVVLPMFICTWIIVSAVERNNVVEGSRRLLSENYDLRRQVSELVEKNKEGV